MIAPGDDVMTLARSLAAAVVTGSIDDVDARTLRGAFPCATFASILLRGSPSTLVLMGNLFESGFMTQSLLPVEHCDCVLTGISQLLHSEQFPDLVPFACELLTPYLLCIPVPSLPSLWKAGDPKSSGGHPPVAIGALVIGLTEDYLRHEGLSTNASDLTRALQLALPGPAVSSAQSAVGARGPGVTTSA